jgi:hypothetical protein
MPRQSIWLRIPLFAGNHHCCKTPKAPISIQLCLRKTILMHPGYLKAGSFGLVHKRIRIACSGAWSHASFLLSTPNCYVQRQELPPSLKLGTKYYVIWTPIQQIHRSTKIGSPVTKASCNASGLPVTSSSATSVSQTLNHSISIQQVVRNESRTKTRMKTRHYAGACRLWCYSVLQTSCRGA